MVDVSIRLRKAVLQNDLALSRRILKANPSYLRNPDLSSKSNTSLHLAAQHGYLDIVDYLISLGHDASGPSTTGPISWHPNTTLGPSYNTDGDTPLHLAASHSHAEVVELLCSNFPTTVDRANKEGATPLHLACQAHPPPSVQLSPQPGKISPKTGEDNYTVEALLRHNANVHAVDYKGDSSLHYASTWGNLRSIRALFQAGADPIRRNYQGWTPQAYSISVQAEVYYKTLVTEWERRKAEEAIRTKERRGRGGGGLRLVQDDASRVGQRVEDNDSKHRAESMDSIASTATGDGLYVTLQTNDTWK